MRLRHTIGATTLLAFTLLLSAPCSAEIYVTDQFSQSIYKFSEGETVGTITNPDIPIAHIRDIEIDTVTEILLAMGSEILLYNPAEQSVVVLDDGSPTFPPSGVFADALSDDIYVVRHSVIAEGDTLPQPDPVLEYLPGGMGPAEVALSFEDSAELRDVQVYPFGPRSGNILVLSGRPPFLAEVERTGPTSFVRLDNIFDADAMNLRGFTITPEGEVLVLGFHEGVFRVEDGELVPFGELTGPKLLDISCDAEGTVYVTDDQENVVHRLGPDGVESRRSSREATRLPRRSPAPSA